MHKEVACSETRLVNPFGDVGTPKTIWAAWVLDRGYASFREHAFHALEGALEGIDVKTTQPFDLPWASLGGWVNTYAIPVL
jgi:hypothetical protein